MNDPLVFVQLNEHALLMHIMRDPNGNLEFRSQHRCSPLHIAAMNPNDDASQVEMLLRMQVDINQKAESDENTALHRATMAKNLNIVNTLLNHGADHSLTDKNGFTALFYAAGPRKAEILSNVYPHRNQLPILRSLLNHGADVNARNPQGQTPLMFAAKGFSLDIIKVLLEAGADVHCKDRLNRTCLHHLFSHPGRTKIMVELIKAGASVMDLDGNGVDPIRYIVTSRKYNVVQKVKEVKELIRCATLVKYPEILNLPTDDAISNRIGLFKDLCYKEVETMQSISLSTNWTVREFALLGIDENSESRLDSYFERLMGEHFVVYNDYIADHFNREYLVNRIMQMEIVIYSSNDQMDVKLPNHFKEDFCSSLTKNDIYNLLNVIFNSLPPN